MNKSAMRNEMNEAALKLLDYWMQKPIDNKNGGFFNVSCWNEVLEGGEKSATLNFRIFWTFTQAYLYFGDLRYLEQANRAYAYIVDHFLDQEFGGAYSILDAEGNPISTDKQGYVHSFAIAAFAAYYRATGCEESLRQAEDLFHLVTTRGKNAYGGYYDICTRDWTPTKLHTQPMVAGDERDQSLRPNMHLLWGFEQLRLAKQSLELDQAICELALLLGTKLADPATGEVGQAFTGEWERVSDRDSYGDDFELAWILWEALHVLPDQQSAQELNEICTRIVRHAALSGMDREYGGIYQQYYEGRIITEKEWWVQTEAINGLLAAYRKTGNIEWLRDAETCWAFIRRYLQQPDGTWNWKTKRNGKLFKTWEIRGPLMCPYHIGRMLMMSLELLKEDE